MISFSWFVVESDLMKFVNKGPHSKGLETMDLLTHKNNNNQEK